ncbi:MAG: Glutathione S-transferase [Aureobasidium pullulans]|nr:MAG: Glutathione S-transferase [Aureobasidium pullulans]
MASNPSDDTTKASANHKVNPRVTSRIEDIDLSKLESDGTNQQPNLPDPSPLPATRGLSRLMGRTFLTHLTREFNNGRHVEALGYWPRPVGKPPSGYTIYFVNRGSGTGIRVMIFGHPKGPTDSLAHFVEHVVSIIQYNSIWTLAVVPAPT